MFSARCMNISGAKTTSMRSPLPARRLNSIEVDRTKVKPVVKITGEFWAQITEGDGNFHMFEFLEREGAQVLVEPIATWVAYLLYQAKAHAKAKWPANRPHRNPKWWELKKHLANDVGLRKKLVGLSSANGCGTACITGRSSISAGLRITWCRKRSWPKWPILSTTNLRVVEKDILRSGKTSTTRSTGCAIWCWR